MQWRCFLLHCIYERFNPNRPLEPVRILCIVEHVACLILEGVAGYVERIRRARCRQANERWTGSDGKELKWLISVLTTDWGLKYPHSIALSCRNQAIVEDGARAHECSPWRQMQPMLRVVLWACAFSWFYFGSVSNSLCLCLARLYIIWCRFK